MNIYKVVVDELPHNCGQYISIKYVSDSYPVCYGIVDKRIREIEGNPYDMQYRRSDCPLVKLEDEEQ